MNIIQNESSTETDQNLETQMLPQEEPVSPREELSQLDTTLTQHTRISAA